MEGSPMVYCDDGTLPPRSALPQWGPIFFSAGRKLNRSFEMLEDDVQVKAMKRLGLEDVQAVNIKVPTYYLPTHICILDIPSSSCVCDRFVSVRFCVCVLVPFLLSKSRIPHAPASPSVLLTTLVCPPQCPINGWSKDPKFKAMGHMRIGRRGLLLPRGKRVPGLDRARCLPLQPPCTSRDPQHRLPWLLVVPGRLGP